jgi:hypothetical protein
VLDEATEELREWGRDITSIKDGVADIGGKVTMMVDGIVELRNYFGVGEPAPGQEGAV